MQAEYNQNKGDSDTVDAYIDFLQTQIKTDVSVLQNTPVMICKDGEMASTLEKGERAIWVEYIPEKDPYATSRDPMKRCVRAAYIYYPVDCDPALEALLGSASNIVKFGKGFRHRFIARDTGYGVFHFAFRVKGKPGTDYPFDDLPETTRLLKSIKEHYKQGRGIYAVSGVFFPDEMP